jgi:hypothetical protein
MKRRRWRGPALGGPLQRGARYCFAAFDGEATTAQLTEWCRPEIVHAGGKPTAFQMVNQCTALRSIGASRVRRHGKGWVWRLNDGEVEVGMQPDPIFRRRMICAQTRRLWLNGFHAQHRARCTVSDDFEQSPLAYSEEPAPNCAPFWHSYLDFSLHITTGIGAARPRGLEAPIVST